MTELVAVDGLRHSYDGHVAVDDVSFVVRAGEVCGYLGPNGAGKTTTFNALAGLLRPTAGRVSIAGCSHVDDPLGARRALGYVPDDGALYPLLSAREHYALIADLYGLEPAAVVTSAMALSERLDAVATLDRRVDSLSRGQRQRVALIAGLLHAPRVLLLDEPLTGLDAHAIVEVKALLRERADAGCAVVFCSHVLDVVERLCDRCVIIDKGRVVVDEPTATLVAGASLEAVFRRVTA